MSLTDAQVVAMRERYASGATQVQLAAEFGVGQTTVSAIVSGRTRAGAGGPVSTRTTATTQRSRPAGEAAPKRRRASSPLTEEAVAQVKARVDAGEPRAAVADALGLSVHTVHSILSGRRGAAAAAAAPAPGRLDATTVTRIRALGATGMAQSAIAAEAGTSQQVVSGILQGRTYRGVGEGDSSHI